MAIDGYMYFLDYEDGYLASESQIDFRTEGQQKEIIQPFQDAFGGKLSGNVAKDVNGAKKCGLFEIEDYSFDVEQVLNIGSQSSGAGAGKVTFNPFSITRKIDCSSATMFSNACAGKPFMEVGLGLRKSGPSRAGVSGVMFLAFTFKLVAIKTLSWAHDDEAPKETVTFDYGGLHINYLQQKADGNLVQAPPRGWNRVRNVAADDVKQFKIV